MTSRVPGRDRAGDSRRNPAPRGPVSQTRWPALRRARRKANTRPDLADPGTPIPHRSSRGLFPQDPGRTFSSRRETSPERPFVSGPGRLQDRVDTLGRGIEEQAHPALVFGRGRRQRVHEGRRGFSAHWPRKLQSPGRLWKNKIIRRFNGLSMIKESRRCLPAEIGSEIWKPEEALASDDSVDRGVNPLAQRAQLERLQGRSRRLCLAPARLPAECSPSQPSTIPLNGRRDVDVAARNAHRFSRDPATPRLALESGNTCRPAKTELGRCRRRGPAKNAFDVPRCPLEVLRMHTASPSVAGC